jgi:hypothetical protein
MYYITGPNTSITLTSTQVTLVTIAIIWELIWKGLALWRAGRNHQPVWFIVLLIVNSLGLLEIIYLLAFQRKTKHAPASH